MEAKKPARRGIRECRNGDDVHELLIQTLAIAINDTPLTLKGGTALRLVYGLDRFSEDLDFDASKKLNLESRIRHNMPYGVKLDSIDLLKNSATFMRYRVGYHSEFEERILKLEISYRTPAPDSAVRFTNNIRVGALPRIIGQKLEAAYDGKETRSKARDLYDLDFLSRRWSPAFDDVLADRLRLFSVDPDVLVSRYIVDYEDDLLIEKLVNLEDLAVRIGYAAEEIPTCRPEIVRRVENLDSLKNKAGAAYSFWEHACEAIAQAKQSGAGNNSPYEANWYLAEQKAIEESIAVHGQEPEAVAEAICKYSPGAATNTRQNEIYEMIEKSSEYLIGQYGKSTNSREHDF